MICWLFCIVFMLPAMYYILRPMRWMFIARLEGIGTLGAFGGGRLEVELGALLVVFSQCVFGLFHEVLTLFHGLGGFAGHSFGGDLHFNQCVLHRWGLFLRLLASHLVVVVYKYKLIFIK